MTNSRKKITSFFTKALLAIALVTLVASGIPTLNVNASTYSDTSDRNKKLKMYLYAVLVKTCYEGNDKVETNTTKVGDGQLFYSNAGDATPIVYSVSPAIMSEVAGFGDDYWTGCGHDDGALTKAALASWGISGTELVCKMGYVRNGDGSSCTQTTTENFKSWGGIDSVDTRVSKFSSAISSLVGLNINNPGDDILYMRWRSVVVDACTTGQGVIKSKADVTGDLRYELKEVKDNQEVIMVYSGGNKKSETPHGTPVSYNCGDALTKANGYFSAYFNATQELAAEQKCKAQGYENIPGGSFPGKYTLNACVQGMLNKGNDTFCAKTYPDYTYQGAPISRADERAACEWGQTQTADTDTITAGENSEDEDESTSCAIEAIGWVVCPVVNFLSMIADASFDFLSDNFLYTDPKAFNTTSTTYNAWVTVRNVANVAFVIIFLIIIFSQLTGQGVSNYGVKKMLPRLIVGAVLVNLSFFISQIAVDLSNILGYSIRDVFNALSGSISMGGGSPVSSAATGEGFAGIAGLILAGVVAGAALYAMLSVLIPVILAAVLALVMILFILVARQALIIIFVILSPLAFVALLLPNTEFLFKQWRKIFTAMLLVFPIIALVFGASSLASSVLTETFTGQVEGDSSNMFGQIIAGAVLTLPLFVVPTLLKKSLDSVPMLGQLASRMSGKANARVGAKVKDSYRGSIMGRGSAIRRQARENYRSRKFADRVSKGGVIGGINQTLASGIPMTGADRHANTILARTAEEASLEAEAKDVVAAGRSMSGRIDRNGARALAMGSNARSLDGKRNFSGSDLASRMAAIDHVTSTNDIAGMNQLWDASQSWTGSEGDKLRSHLAKSIQGSGSKPSYFGAGALESLRTNQHGGTSSSKLMTDAVAADAYSPEKVAGADKDELAAVYHADRDRSATDASYATSHGSKLSGAASQALSDPQLNRTVGKNRAAVEGIAGGPGSTPPPTVK